MPISYRSKLRGLVCGALLTGMAGGAAYLSYDEGWITSFPWMAPPEAARDPLTLDEFDDEATGPQDDDFELAVSEVPSQSELGEPNVESGIDHQPVSRRHGVTGRTQWTANEIPAPRLDDSDEISSGRSKIATVGFDEDAPSAPSEPDEGTADERGPAKREKTAVDARPGD